MALTFPYTSRSFIRFRHSDTGLTPTFSYFKRADTLVNLTAPVIHEVGSGTYYFDFTFASPSDPDIVFEIDGGASIPTEEVRYVSDTISINDRFLDEPISQVVTDVWEDTAAHGGGSTGEQLRFIGTGTDDVRTETTLFGRLYSGIAQIMGANIAEWNPFPNFGGINVKEVYDRIGAPASGDISNDIQNSLAQLEGDVTAAVSNIKGTPGKDLTQVDQHLTTTETNLANAISGVANSAAAVPADLVARLDYLRDSTQRVLGLTKENSVLKNTHFDTQGNLIQGDFFIYPDAASAQAGAGEIASYRITAQWDGQKVQNYSMVKQP